MAGPPQHRRHLTHLADDQWALVEPRLRPNRGPGRPTQLHLCEVVNALQWLCPKTPGPGPLFGQEWVFGQSPSSYHGTVAPACQAIGQSLPGAVSTFGYAQ